MATSDQMAVLSALSKADGPVVVEEIAAMASISFERAWYTVLELIELRFISMAGISLYVVTARGIEAADRIARQQGISGIASKFGIRGTKIQIKQLFRNTACRPPLT